MLPALATFRRRATGEDRSEDQAECVNVCLAQSGTRRSFDSVRSSFNEFPDESDNQFRLVELDPVRASGGNHVAPVR
jgi:hypothetical protein